jgi:hypothetical protein
MTDERDDLLFARAAASLRAPGRREAEALEDVLVALRGETADGLDASGIGAGPRRRRSAVAAFGTRRRGWRGGTVRFIAGLAAGVAFAAGLGLGLFTGWRMRGASYRLAAEDMRLAQPLPGSRVFTDATLGNVPRPVQFMLVAPSATRVSLVGEFNDWDPAATPMARAPGGAWHVALPLPRGRHVYSFVVDGSAWVADPQAPLAPEQWFGTRNSVMLVDGGRSQ